MKSVSTRLRTLLINLFNDPDEEVCCLDTDFSILWVNDTLERKGFGLSRVYGSKSYQVFDNIDVISPDSPSLRCMNENKVINSIKKGYDGKDYDIISIPIHDDKGKIAFIVELTRLVRESVSRDIDLRTLATFEEITKLDKIPKFEKEDIVLVLIDPLQYYDKSVDLLEMLLKSGLEGICITYSERTYDMVISLEGRNIDTDKIKFVDGISCERGKGTPPVKYCITVYPPKNYQDIYYYTFLTLNLMPEERFIMYLNIERLLEYLSHDDVGISLLTTLEKLQKNTIQLILLPENVENKLLEAIIKRLVTKVIRI